MSSIYAQIWERLKAEGKIQVQVDGAEDMDFPEICRRFHQIRKHVSDRKAKDLIFRQANPLIYIITLAKDFKTGIILLSLTGRTDQAIAPRLRGNSK